MQSHHPVLDPVLDPVLAPVQDPALTAVQHRILLHDLHSVYRIQIFDDILSRDVNCVWNGTGGGTDEFG